MQKKPKLQNDVTSSDPTFAIAFGGGGARGYAHIHIIEVLDELGIKPVAISGASIGSIMGAAMASGMKGREIREYALDLASNRTEVLTRYIKASPPKISNIFSRENTIGQLDALEILKEFLPEQIKPNFEALDIPMSISTTDYYAYKELEFSTGDLFLAMAASASIPVVFKPVKYEGRFLVDGGIFNPVPFEHLKGKADIVIGIDVVGTPAGNSNVAPRAMDSAYGASQLMMQSILSYKLTLDPPDIFLRPDISGYRVQDFFKAEKILAQSEGVRDELKRSIDRVLQNAG